MWLAHNGDESDSGSAKEKLDALNRAGSRIQELVERIDALPCKSCASSTVTLELAIRHAIEEACPDLIGFEVEGAPALSPGVAVATNAQRATPDWIAVDNALQLGNEAGMSVRVGALRLIGCRVNGNLYAYRNNSPTCNMPLNVGILDRGLLRCGLGHQYDVRQAGRSPDNPNVHLDPFPLLVRDDVVKVAVVGEASRIVS